MLRISWTEHVTNEEVVNTANTASLLGRTEMSTRERKDRSPPAMEVGPVTGDV